MTRKEKLFQSLIDWYNTHKDIYSPHYLTSRHKYYGLRLFCACGRVYVTLNYDMHRRNRKYYAPEAYMPLMQHLYHNIITEEDVDKLEAHFLRHLL